MTIASILFALGAMCCILNGSYFCRLLWKEAMTDT